MSPQEFILERLEKVKTLPKLPIPKDTASLEAEILRLLLSKKFRKYSANDDLIEHCKQAISAQVAKNEPINITFVHGAYKLWRLGESPFVDWAELFSLMYYTNWVKGICQIYKPGVWFDFFVDDWIVPILDNVPESDITSYIESYNQLIDFLKPWQPDNLKMTITPVGSQFESKAMFEQMLKAETEKLNKEGLPNLDDATKAMVELNVKTTPEQEADPQWQEKVWQIHKAYMPVKKSANYHYRPEKILAFTQPLPSGTTISVGTTKSSIMKFWVGAGALNRKDNSYQETILSPSQLESGEFDWFDTKIDHLIGKNFERIRVLK